MINKQGYEHLLSEVVYLHLILQEIPFIFKADITLALWPWRVYQFLKEQCTRMKQCWSAVTQQKKVGMTKPNWTLNYHICEPVVFILDLKVGKKDIRQIYTPHALLFTERRTLAVNNLMAEDYQNLKKSYSENSI